MKTAIGRKARLLAAASSLAASALSMAPMNVLAQERAAGQGAGLEEVVVVARRTEERLQTVPLSVTAVSNEQLRSANITSGTDLQRLVPTLNVQQNSTGPGLSYSLRGVRTGVVTYFNEVPIDTSAADLQLWDINSIQALSGPQGTLFGRNSTGGAILFVPQAPTGNYGADITGRLGNYNERDLTAVVNLPLSEMLKVRLGARLTKRDGVVENQLGPDMQSKDREAFRAAVLFEPTDWLSNYTIYDRATRDEQPFPNVTTALAVSPCPVGTLACLYGLPLLLSERDAQLRNGNRVIRHPYIQGLTETQWGVTNTLKAELGNVTAKYIYGHRYGESWHAKDGTSLALPFIVGENETLYDKRTTNEIQLLGNAFDQRFDWVLGYYSARNKSEFGAYRVLFGQIGVPYNRINTSASGGNTNGKSGAFYGQATVKLGQFRLTGGLRRTEDKTSVSQQSRSPGAICNLPNIFGVNLAACRRNLSASFSATTYNLSVDYQATENVLLYATHRKGYNTGGFNIGIPDPALVAYDPEYISDFEGGIKADWRIGQMPIRTNIAAYHAKYEDIQRSTNVIRGGLSYVGVFNAAEATLYGLRSDVLVRPLSNLDVSASYGYLNTKYDSFDNPLIGNATGNKFAQAPEHTLNLSVSYRHDLAAGGTLVGTASYAYQSEITFVDANLNSPNAFQKGYGLVDLRLDWKSVANRPVDIGVYVKNATDKEYAINILDQTSTFGFVSATFADRRTYGIELRYRWGS